jgi:NhaP-type Na+/H+ or K+/H+ antiporter
LILSLTYAVVVFSILGQGLTIKGVIARVSGQTAHDDPDRNIDDDAPVR